MKKTWLIWIALFVVAACSQRPVVTFEVMTPAPAASATPWVEGTQMDLASPTPWLAGTQTALAASSPNPFPEVTQELIERPTDFSPVLYGGKVYDTTFFLLLGGVSRDSWIAPETSVQQFDGEVTYSLHSLTQQAKYFIWGETAERSPTCASYFIGTEASMDEAGFVGVVDIWNVMKRDVTEVSADSQIYQEVVLDWLADEGVSSPELDQLHIYRVDLEGDGSDEIFINATRYLDESQHTAAAGDHSIVLMRKVEGNDVVTVFIAGDVYRGPETETILPKTYSITNFIDLNQDGILEIVLEARRWEGFGARVYQVEDQAVTERLSAGCGL